MAALDDTTRQKIHFECMREESAIHADLPLTKAQLRAAVNATDDWIDTNRSSFVSAINAALPSPGALTGRQKAKLFLMVASRRYDIS